jgi:hypothetical protein
MWLWKSWEETWFEEGASWNVSQAGTKDRDWTGQEKDVLHASRAACPVTIMEVEALALENEGAEAILHVWSVSSVKKKSHRLKNLPDWMPQSSHLEPASL